MKKLILLLFMVSAVTLFARPRLTSYLYEYNGDKLVLIQKSNTPLIKKNSNQVVVNLDRGTKPTEVQLESLNSNIEKLNGFDEKVERFLKEKGLLEKANRKF